MFGHQFVCHLNPEIGKAGNVPAYTNPVDGHAVPVPHYGVVLAMAVWQALADKLQQKNIKFLIDPYIRFKGEPGEQATMFFLDPSGNPLEFKGFRELSSLFEK